MASAYTHTYSRRTVLTLILQLPPILIPPPPPCAVPVLDAMAVLPVAVCVIPDMPDIPVMTAEVAVAIISCPEWSMVALYVVAGCASGRGVRM